MFVFYSPKLRDQGTLLEQRCPGNIGFTIGGSSIIYFRLTTLSAFAHGIWAGIFSALTLVVDNLIATMHLRL